MYTLEYLLTHSNLPGPRGNLELLYAFAKEANEDMVGECLSAIGPQTANSPEEFVGMCGILGFAVIHQDDLASTLDFLRQYASHDSWRLREAVAISIQEIALGRMDRIVGGLQDWAEGNPLEKRAVVAALCEPKLLKMHESNLMIIDLLKRMTDPFNNADKLDDQQKVLRQALAYGWSVLIAAQPTEGKRAFESYLSSNNKHIRWILQENLKKNRLIKMDKDWVEKMKSSL